MASQAAEAGFISYLCLQKFLQIRRVECNPATGCAGIGMSFRPVPPGKHIGHSTIRFTDMPIGSCSGNSKYHTLQRSVTSDTSLFELFHKSPSFLCGRTLSSVSHSIAYVSRNL